MSQMTDERVNRAAVHDHLVQVYREPSQLADCVSAYLATGFELNEPAIVVVSAAHWPLVHERLERKGFDLSGLAKDNMLFVEDAHTTLESILENGKPSLRQFTSVIGGLMDRAVGGVPNRRLRAFGEMVDLLSRRGDLLGADALEELWNRLAMRRNFSLLCGYKLDVFDRETQASVLPRVCASHSHVLDADPLLNTAVDTALRTTLGSADAQKVYAKAALQGKNTNVPAAQLALMWVSAHMPRAADRVLAAARENYVATAAA